MLYEHEEKREAIIQLNMPYYVWRDIVKLAYKNNIHPIEQAVALLQRGLGVSGSPDNDDDDLAA